MKTNLLMIALALTLSGCATMGNYWPTVTFPSSTDPKTKITVAGEYFEQLKGSFIQYGYMLYWTDAAALNHVLSSDSDTIILQKTTDELGVSYYMLKEIYTGSNWRFMTKLDVSIDGEVTEFVDEHPSRVVGTVVGNSVLSGGVTETLSFVVKEDFVTRLGTAKQVRFQFAGDPVSMIPQRLTELPDVVAKLKELKYVTKASK